MKYILLNLLLFISFNSFNQVIDNFSDDNFSSNPEWFGSTDLFLVENGELRSNSAAANTYYLSTPSTLATNAEWSFYFNLRFATSGSNYVDIYLMADNSDLLLAQNGYFVRAGNTTDEVSLYSLVNGVSTKIIDGIDNTINSSTNNPFNIRVKRDASNLWTLETDDGNSGVFVLEGSIVDNSISSSSHFGVKIVQSSAASVVNNHFFDNFSIGTIGVDNTPPSLVQINVISSTQLDLLFSENLNQTSAEAINNYDIQPFLTATSIQLDAVNKALVHLTPTNPFNSGTSYNLIVSGILDLTGNILVSQSMTFSYNEIVTALPGDIIINEFMADPSPVVGLPEVEFVEIYNKSSKTINLQNFKLADNAAQGTIASALINPGEYKVLCATANVGLFSNAIGVTSFQGLNNTSDDISLSNENGIIIDKISYDLTWYQDDSKSNGGYSIELKNSNSICGGNASNWAASIHPSGGTPGEQNSIFDNTPDTEKPYLLGLEVIEPNFLNILFSEKMDSISLINTSVSVSNLSVANRFLSDSYPSNLLISFNENFSPSSIYTITLNNIADCSQNFTSVSGEFSIAEKPEVGDIIINEILFDPVTNGSDYIEIKNISTKIINVKGLQLANFKDSIANIKSVVFTKNIKPNDFVVFTSDSSFQKTQYPFAVSGKFVQMSLPSYNNDSGTVYLLFENKLVDKVSYSDKWHFQLLDNEDGKSLERLDPLGLSDNKNNWHTASQAVNFGTPGAENSQIMYGEQNGIISLTNPTFSPDNDGFEDVLQINYSTVNPGMLANVTIYDDRGRLIHNLVQNEYLGTKGSLVWDGTTYAKQKASIGVYVLVFEAFDLDGNNLTKKLAFVLAGK
jgi:hypothetical protein